MEGFSGFIYQLDVQFDAQTKTKKFCDEDGIKRTLSSMKTRLTCRLDYIVDPSERMQ